MKKELIQPLIIIILTALLALSWGRKGVKTPDPIRIDSIIYVNNTIVDTMYVPTIDTVIVPKYIKETVINNHIDTVFIVGDYYLEKYYKDTLQDDSVAFAYIEEMVSQNIIQNRKFKLDVKGKTVIKNYTKIEYREKAHFYLGTSITTGTNMFLNATYKTPYKGQYRVGYDPIHGYIQLGVDFKIF